MVATPDTPVAETPAPAPTAPDETGEPLAEEVLPVSVVLPAPTDGSTLPIPKATPGAWLSTPDYPTDALAEGRSGTTSFQLEVDKTGHVSNCTIIISSGHKDLDDAACEMVGRRALFEPATDKKGNKVAGIYQNSVNWRIPTAVDLPKPGQTTAVFVVERDGSVSDCKFESTVEAPPDYDGCANAPTFEPRRDENGDPVRVRVVISSVTKIFKLPAKPAESE